MTLPKTREDLLRFVRGEKHWVVATQSMDGAPQAAVVGVAVTDQFEIVFDTLDDTRKAQNLRRDPRVAFVMWIGDATVQLEGLADEPSGAELGRIKAVYFAHFVTGSERESWPGITYVRVRPTWCRYTHFNPGPGHDGPYVVELRAGEFRPSAEG